MNIKVLCTFSFLFNLNSTNSMVLCTFFRDSVPYYLVYISINAQLKVQSTELFYLFRIDCHGIVRLKSYFLYRTHVNLVSGAFCFIEYDYPQCVQIYIPVRCTFGFAGLTISTKIIGTLSL